MNSDYYDYLSNDLCLTIEAAAAVVQAASECSRLGLHCILNHNNGTTQYALAVAIGRLEAMADILKTEEVTTEEDLGQGLEYQYQEIEKNYEQRIDNGSAS